MKTTCTPKKQTINLFRDKGCNKPVGTINIPEFETLPQVVIVGETIYLQQDSHYSWSKIQYFAVGPMYVASPDEVITPEQEDAATAAPTRAELDI